MTEDEPVLAPEGEPMMLTQAVSNAICAIMADAPSVPRDEYNSHYKRRYASVEAVLTVMRPLLAKHKLSIVATEREFRPLDSGILVTFDFYMHAEKDVAMSGPFRRSVIVGQRTSQSSGIAKSYLEKEFLKGTFKLDTGDPDSDTEKQTGGSGRVAIDMAGKAQQRKATGDNLATDSQRKAIMALMGSLKVTDKRSTIYAHFQAGGGSTKLLQKGPASEVISMLSAAQEGDRSLLDSILLEAE